MKICVLGLGAIGGVLASRLASLTSDSQVQLSALARGATLEAVKSRGLRLRQKGQPGENIHRFTVSDQAAQLGVQDYLFVTTKTTALLPLARQVQSMIGPNTTIVSIMNGVPWWFFHGFVPALAKEPLQSVDPRGEVSSLLPAEQVIGTVTHLSASCPAPGLVMHHGGEKIILGEPNAGTSIRLGKLQAVLQQSGLDAPIAPQRIQFDIWFKLLGNMSMNPLSAITGATAEQMLDSSEVRQFASACMREMMAVGEEIGLSLQTDPEERHAVTRKLGPFKTSMLQDVEAGRAIELDALVAAVVEIAKRKQVAVPTIESLLGLTRLFAQTKGLYPK